MGDYDDMVLAERILRDSRPLRPTDGFRLADLHEVTSVVVEGAYRGGDDCWIPQSAVLRAGHPDAMRRLEAADLLGKPVASGGDQDGHVLVLPAELPSSLEGLTVLDELIKLRQSHFVSSCSFRETVLMQNRLPVGFGPSSKTWPRCASQRAQTTSVRRMNRLWS